MTQYLEVREKQYDKKAYVDFFTVSYKIPELMTNGVLPKS